MYAMCVCHNYYGTRAGQLLIYVKTKPTMLMTLTAAASAAAAVACFCFCFFLCFSSFNKFKIKFSLNCRQSRRRPGQNPIRRKCLPAPTHSAAAPAASLPSAQLAKLHASAGISLSLSFSLLGIGSVEAQIQLFGSLQFGFCLSHCLSLSLPSSPSLSLGDI